MMQGVIDKDSIKFGREIKLFAVGNTEGALGVDAFARGAAFGEGNHVGGEVKARDEIAHTRQENAGPTGSTADIQNASAFGQVEHLDDGGKIAKEARGFGGVGSAERFFVEPHAVESAGILDVIYFVLFAHGGLGIWTRMNTGLHGKEAVLITFAERKVKNGGEHAQTHDENVERQKKHRFDRKGESAFLGEKI